MLTILALVTFALWLVYEWWLIRQTTQRLKAGRTVDQGTSLMIIVGMLSGLAISLVCRFLKIAYVDDSVAFWGLLFMVFGAVFRIWAVRVMGEMFTPKVSILEGHQLIQQGPYKVIRHPSYTGAIMVFAGMGLAMNSWLAALLYALIFVGIYGYRLALEERLLLESLGEPYRAYRKQTWRLFPFVY